MAKTLIIGYGNPDRQDDGVAWHVINQLAAKLELTGFPDSEETQVHSGKHADLMFQLQLTPETAEVIASYEAVCFVDAHTGAVKNDLNFVEISPNYQASPFTHHMTPQTCLSIAQNLFKHSPSSAVLVSIRGYSFGFRRDLSEKTLDLAADAIEQIYKWIQNISPSALSNLDK